MAKPQKQNASSAFFFFFLLLPSSDQKVCGVCLCDRERRRGLVYIESLRLDAVVMGIVEYH